MPKSVLELCKESAGGRRRWGGFFLLKEDVFFLESEGCKIANGISKVSFVVFYLCLDNFNGWVLKLRVGNIAYCLWLILSLVGGGCDWGGILNMVYLKFRSAGQNWRCTCFGWNSHSFQRTSPKPTNPRTPFKIHTVTKTSLLVAFPGLLETGVIADQNQIDQKRPLNFEALTWKHNIHKMRPLLSFLMEWHGYPLNGQKQSLYGFQWGYYYTPISVEFYGFHWGIATYKWPSYGFHSGYLHPYFSRTSNDLTRTSLVIICLAHSCRTASTFTPRCFQSIVVPWHSFGPSLMLMPRQAPPVIVPR